MNLKEAYRLVLADLQDRAELDELRDQVGKIVGGAGDEILIQGIESDEFKYVSLKLRDAIVVAIRDAGYPLSSARLAKELAAGGYNRDLSTRTLHAATSRHVKGRVLVEVKPHVWDLAERYPNSRDSHQSVASVASVPA